MYTINKVSYLIPLFLLFFLAKAEAQTDTISFFVDGVCGMCKTRIEKNALQVEGVQEATWNMAERQFTAIVRENTDIYQLHWTLAQAGHDTEELKAPTAAYESLDPCCAYRDPFIVGAHQPRDQAGGSTKSEAKDLSQVSGEIVRIDEDGVREPLIGVNVYWLDSQQGTSTNVEGRFTLERPEDARFLIASYVGYAPDTIEVDEDNYVGIELSESYTMETVEVSYRKKATEYSFLDPVKVQIINEDELLKAACCNLSESFTTNPSVDVSFTDAVTGARQIQMLGLAGPYTQITKENMPDIRGLSNVYGLTFMPGPWLEGLQLIKGSGSVVNGYEAIAGQINLELWKPEKADPLYLNFYGNEGSRIEGNAAINQSLGENVHTGLLLHGKTQQAVQDRNDDGFMDNHVGNNFFALNRWKFEGNDGWSGQLGLRGIYMEQESGQNASLLPEGSPSNGLWRADIRTRRADGWAKIGKVFSDKPGTSIGLQLSGFVHDHESTFGDRPYDAQQQNGYANLIYQSILGTTFHKYKAGLSFQYDRLEEHLGDQFFTRNEIVPGAFFEYTYSPGEQFTAVAGLRGDYHNNFGFFATPRLHLRYAFNDLTVVRASAGQGRRTASILAENIGPLASARNYVVRSMDADNPYGLDQEVAWNFGLNLTQGFDFLDRPSVLSLDAYHTRFQQQIIVDLDQDPQEINFYNLDGDSYATSLQAQVDMELARGLDVRMAYRYNDVQQTYDQDLRERPFVSRHRAFINTAYESRSAWKLDLTLNWQGTQRIPDTQEKPVGLRMDPRSPDFLLVNAQVSKTWEEQFEFYLGAENLFNYRQPNPILDSAQPFSPDFDASLIWGPVFGRMVYAGVRYRLGG